MIAVIGMDWDDFINLSSDKQTNILSKLNKQELRDLYRFYWFISGPSKYGDLISEAMARIDLAQ